MKTVDHGWQTDGQEQIVAFEVKYMIHYGLLFLKTPALDGK